MVIEFDPAKDAANIAKHGLSLSLAASFDAAVVVPTYSGNDANRYKMLENTVHGLLVAIVTHRGDRIRIISLRRANKSEERMYAKALR